MRRLTGILAVVALLVAAALLPMSSALAGGPGGGGEQPPVNNDVPNNIVPPDLVIQDTHAAEQAASLKIKEAEMAALSSAPPAFLSSPVMLSVPGVDQRPCKNYCGPAATQEIFYFKGEHSYTLTDIALMEQTDGGSADCWVAGGEEQDGTCILPIRDTLNQHTPDLPWANFYIAERLNHDSLSDAGFDLRNIQVSDIGSHEMPFIVLLDANPNDGTPYCLPGYCGGPTGIVHYVTVNGYAGDDDGSDWTGQTYYRDSWYNPDDQHYTDHNYFTDCIYFNDGLGGCSGNTDIVW